MIRLETKQATSDKTSDKSKRLIYAEDLLGTLKRRILFIGSRNGKTMALFEAILRNLIKMTPTVDAAPVIHGHWDEGVHHDYCCCSNCRDVYILAEWLTDGKWNYCPNCGAKMDGGKMNGLNPDVVIVDEPETNGDRVRSMSNEKLANLLGDKCVCPASGECAETSGNCDSCWLKWLKKPAEDG